MQPYPNLHQVLKDGVFYVDNSLIELITTCPMEAWFAQGLKQRRSGDNAALRFGGIIHSALAYRYRREATGKPWNFETQMRILARRFASMPCENEGWRNLNMAKEVLLHYNEDHLLDLITVQRTGPYQFPFVEKPFAIVVGKVRIHLPNGTYVDVTIVYIGRIDLLVYMEKKEELFVMDHKTTTMLGETYWKDAAVSEQQRGYCFAVQESLGVTPNGYVMNVLALRPPTKTGVSMEFKRSIYRTKIPYDQIPAWRDNMLKQVTNYLNLLAQNSLTYNHKHCVRKYGVCQFYDVCKGFRPYEEQVKAFETDEWTENTWTPLYH